MVAENAYGRLFPTIEGKATNPNSLFVQHNNTALLKRFKKLR